MKKKLVILLLAGFGIAAQAQPTISANDNGRLLQESRRLIDEKEYPTTLTLLSQIERSTLSAAERQEADYMRAIATFETNSLEGRALMLQYLSDKRRRMWIRHVLVPGVTDDEQELIQIREFISPLHRVRRVEILPYHTMGISKWQKLGLDYPLEGVPMPTAEEVLRAEVLIGAFAGRN